MGKKLENDQAQRFGHVITSVAFHILLVPKKFSYDNNKSKKIKPTEL